MDEEVKDGAERLHVTKRDVWIDYTNHRGERAVRHIRPFELRFGSTPFHPEPQWFLEAVDVDKDAARDFAMKDIHRWFTSPVPGRQRVGGAE